MSAFNRSFPLKLAVAFMLPFSTMARLSAAAAGDAAIEAEVRALLDEHPELGAPLEVHVQAIDRVVYLYGSVDSYRDKLLVQSLASQTRGVTKVVNAIEQQNL
jgi:osmotically-inducible protein OsmY